MYGRETWARTRFLSSFSMKLPPTSLCKTSLRRLPNNLQSSSKLWKEISSAISSVLSVIVEATGHSEKTEPGKTREGKGEERETRERKGAGERGGERWRWRSLGREADLPTPLTARFQLAPASTWDRTSPYNSPRIFRHVAISPISERGSGSFPTFLHPLTQCLRRLHAHLYFFLISCTGQILRISYQKPNGMSHNNFVLL